MRLHRFDDFFAQAKALPKERRQKRSKSRQNRAGDKKTSGKGRNTGVSADELWENGLPSTGTLDAAVWQLFWAGRADGHTARWITEHIVKLLREKHNGYSGDFNKSPEHGERVVRKKLKKLFKRHGATPVNQRVLPPVTRSEVATIINATASALTCSDRHGEELKNFVLQRFLFESLQHHKSFVIGVMQDALDQLREDRPALPTECDEFLQEWLARTAELSPDWARDTFVVQWSDRKRSALSRMKGDSRHAYWFAAQKTEIYTLVAPHRWVDRECALYRVRLDLAADGAETFGEFASAANALLSARERRGMYSRRYAAVISSAESDRPTAPLPVELKRLIERTKKAALMRAA
jgi:hypothetical protein